jgi:hypothetical protein
MSIITALIKATKQESEVSANQLIEAAKDIGWFTVGLANSVAEHFSGLNLVDAGKLAEEKRKERKPERPDFVQLFEDRTTALQNLKKTLSSVYKSDSPKAFVLIDELDRCRPDYSVCYLETIKHIFDVHGLVFILAIDRGQLECSAKRLFGDQLEFTDYFRKFAHRSVSLPLPAAQDIDKLVRHYASRYLKVEGKRDSWLQFGRRIEEVLDIVTKLKMRPRQIQEAFRILGHAMSRSSLKDGTLLPGLEVGTILLACLKVTAHELYSHLVNGNKNHKKVAELLAEAVGHEHFRWWFLLWLTGIEQNETFDSSTAISMMRSVGLETSPEDGPRELSHFASQWGRAHRSINRWRQIADLIESVDTFK